MGIFQKLLHAPDGSSIIEWKSRRMDGVKKVIGRGWVRGSGAVGLAAKMCMSLWQCLDSISKSSSWSQLPAMADHGRYWQNASHLCWKPRLSASTGFVPPPRWDSWGIKQQTWSLSLSRINFFLIFVLKCIVLSIGAWHREFPGCSFNVLSVHLLASPPGEESKGHEYSGKKHLIWPNQRVDHFSKHNILME